MDNISQLNKIKDELRNSVAEGIDCFFREIRRYVKDEESRFKEDLNSLLGQWNRLKGYELKGKIDYDSLFRFHNMIQDSIQKFIDEIDLSDIEMLEGSKGQIYIGFQEGDQDTYEDLRKYISHKIFPNDEIQFVNTSVDANIPPNSIYIFSNYCDDEKVREEALAMFEKIVKERKDLHIIYYGEYAEILKKYRSVKDVEKLHDLPEAIRNFKQYL